MKRIILALSLAAMPLTACATIDRNCERALSGLETAQQVIAVLIARGVEPAIAQKVAAGLTVGQITLSVACAAVPRAPVAVVG